MNITDLPIDQLKEARWNPNVMNEAMLMRLRESISRFGLVSNLVVRTLGADTYEILSGNQRLQVLKDSNVQTAPCVVLDLDDSHARLLAQGLNRIEGTDDLGLKAELVREVLNSIPQSEVMSLLPDSSESLTALVSLGEADMAQHLQAWDQARAARLSPNPPKEGVGLASRGGKKVLLCFWDNGFVAKKRPRKRSTR